jgi:hypothetical protein
MMLCGCAVGRRIMAGFSKIARPEMVMMSGCRKKGKPGVETVARKLYFRFPAPRSYPFVVEGSSSRAGLFHGD